MYRLLNENDYIEVTDYIWDGYLHKWLPMTDPYYKHKFIDYLFKAEYMPPIKRKIND